MTIIGIDLGTSKSAAGAARLSGAGAHGKVVDAQYRENR